MFGVSGVKGSGLSGSGFESEGWELRGAQHGYYVGTWWSKDQGYYYTMCVPGPGIVTKDKDEFIRTTMPEWDTGIPSLKNTMPAVGLVV